jgi:enamine deaminase RidA (YjgF/YER057c/UK114 family)
MAKSRLSPVDETAATWGSRYASCLLKAILAAAGTSLDNVLTATTHLTRVQDLAAYNEEYAKYFPTHKPARTTVTVAALNAPELLIEITVTACIPT